MQTSALLAPADHTTVHDTAVDASRRPRSVGGIVSTGQLTAAGFTRPHIDAMVHAGALVAVHDGVFRTADTVMSTRRRLLAACLAVGGLVGASHRAGLWLWDLSDDEPPIEVTTTRTAHPCPVAVDVHVHADLASDQVSVRRGVPVTSPVRTLADVGSVVDREHLALAVDKALYLRLVTLRTLRAAVEDRAHPGAAALSAVLDHQVHGF